MMTVYRVVFDDAYGDWVIYWSHDDMPLGSYDSLNEAQAAIAQWQGESEGTCSHCQARGEQWDTPTEDGRCYVCHGSLP